MTVLVTECLFILNRHEYPDCGKRVNLYPCKVQVATALRATYTFIKLNYTWLKHRNQGFILTKANSVLANDHIKVAKTNSVHAEGR